MKQNNVLRLSSSCSLLAKTNIWCLFISASTRSYILLQQQPDYAHSFHFAASSQYGTIPDNRMSTPYFLDNTLLNAYLEQMDSRWTEQATGGWWNDEKWAWRLQVLVLLGERVRSGAWKLAACCERHVKILHLNWTETDNSAETWRKEEADLETLRPGDKKPELDWNSNMESMRGQERR